MERYYKIAGLVVKMEANGMTAQRSAPYLCPKTKADIEIRYNKELLENARPHLTAEELEYLGTGHCFYRKLLEFDGLMLHASAVVLDGEAYLFTADSGVGKSTHTRLWLETFGDRAFILNDDKPALRLQNNVWYAYGTPWSGKDDVHTNKRAPIKGIAVLKRGAFNKIRPLSAKEGVALLYKQINHSRHPAYGTLVLNHLDQLMRSVPLWELTCTPHKEAVLTALEGMKGNTDED